LYRGCSPRELAFTMVLDSNLPLKPYGLDRYQVVIPRSGRPVAHFTRVATTWGMTVSLESSYSLQTSKLEGQGIPFPLGNLIRPVSHGRTYK
jgi:hypothetical protein